MSDGVRVNWSAAVSVIAAAAVALIVSAIAPARSDAPPDDAFAVRRILLRPDQLAAELERARRGVLLQMPVPQFEDLLRRASAAVRNGQFAPRLFEARYQAALDGESLAGSAKWKLFHSGHSPILFPVDPFHLALRSAKWSDGRPAVLADLDSGPTAPGSELLVDRTGHSTLVLEWTARGVPEPGGIRFDLRVPSCGIATLDLDLPPEHEPVCSRDGCLVSGPTSSPILDRSRWQIAFGGRSQVELVIRPRAASRSPVLMMVRQQVRLEVVPGQAMCEFSLDLDVRHRAVRELVLELDPALRPIDVTVRNLGRWDARPGDKPDAPTQIAVSFSEPFQGGPLSVRAVAAVPTDRPWISPWVRVVDAVPRGEHLTMRVHPDLAYEDWRAGGFRLLDSARAADRWAVWSLHGGTVRAASTRPSVRFRPRGPDYQVRQRLWWHIRSDIGETLSVQNTFEVSHGPVFSVPFQVPTGWEIERVDGTPADVLAGWTIVPPAAANARPTLVVDFHHPLGTGTTTQLAVTLTRRGTSSRLAGARQAERPLTLAVPDVRPIAARRREGTLALKVMADFQPTWRGADEPGSAQLPADVAARAPWTPVIADVVAALSQGTMSGTVALQPRPARYDARAIAAARVAGQRASVEYRVLLEPQSGGTDAILLHFAAGAGHLWDWRTVGGSNHVRAIQRLDFGTAAAVTPSPWASLAWLAATRDAGSYWVVTFSRPVTEPTEIRASLDIGLPPRSAERAGAWLGGLNTGAALTALSPLAAASAAPEWPVTVPLLSVLSATRFAGEVTVDLSAGQEVEAVTRGLREEPAAAVSPYIRRFAQGREAASLSLMPVGSAGSRQGLIDDSAVRTDITDPEQVVHTLSLRLRDWLLAAIPIGLPADAEVRFVRVNGVPATVAPPNVAAGMNLHVPVPRGSAATNIELTFTTPTCTWFVATSYQGPDVQLPGGVPVRQAWRLPRGVVPLEPGARSPRPAVVGEPGALDWDAPTGFGKAWVVREKDVTAVGIVLGAAVMVVAGLVRSTRGRVTVLVAAFVASGFTAVWLPGAIQALAWWPFGTACLGLVAAAAAPFVRAISAQKLHRPATSAALRHAATATIVLVAWLGTPGRAAAPAPVTVYLIPGTDGEVETVLVPIDFASQLRQHERRLTVAVDGVRVTAARYDGQVAGRMALVTATFDLHCFTDEPATLSLPLSGILLGAAVMDGAPAFPQSAGDRMTLAVRGRGPHTLRLGFQVPVSGSAEEREIRFGVPEVVQTRVALELPAGSHRPHAPARRGAESVTERDGRVRLEADLGRVGTVNVRWWSAAPDAGRAAVRVQEAYLWDLTDAGATLHASLRYAVSGGSVSALSVDLPRDLRVAAVAAQPVAPPMGPAVGWLRQWRVVAADRGSRLILDFAAPVTGDCHVNLALVPSSAWSSAVTLTFPAASGATAAAPAAYAYREQGVVVTPVRIMGLTELAEDTFMSVYWRPAHAEVDVRPPTRAYRRSVGGTAALRVTVAPSMPTVTTTEDWTWRVGPRRAEVKAESRVSVRGGVVSMVEWDVPAGVRVIDLRGPDVSNWSRARGRLQVWLARAVAETTIQWSGVITRPAASVATFALPTIRPTGVPFRGTIRVAGQDGWMVSPAATAQLRPATTGTAGRDLAYTVDVPAYSGSFQVQASAMDGALRLSTVASVRDGRFQSTTAIEGSARDGSSRSLVLSARAAVDTEVRIIDLPTGARVRDVAQASDRRTWAVELPPGATGSWRLTVSAVAPRDATGEWVVPRVDVELPGNRPLRRDREVSLGSGLVPIEASDLRPGGEPHKWQVITDGWILRVRRTGDSGDSQSLFSEVEAARDGTGGWVMRLTGWVAAPPGTTLRWEWPAPVRVRWAELDGSPLPSIATAVTSYRAVRDERPGPCAVVLEWVSDSDSAPPTRLRLPAVFAGETRLTLGPILWTVRSPPGLHPDSPAPLSLTELAIRRTEGQLRLVEWLKAHPAPTQDANRLQRAALERGSQYLRDAEVSLALLPPAAVDEIERLAWRLNRLRERLPAASRSSPPSDADRGAETLPAHSDEPYAWFVPNGATPPVLTWTGPPPRWLNPLIRSVTLAVLFACGGYLIRRRGEGAWPELLVVLAIVTWVVANVGWPWLFAILSGVLVRVALVIRDALRPTPDLPSSAPA